MSSRPTPAGMTRVIQSGCRLLEGLMALILAAMVLLVFGNVVLRYGFNSGISVSEELARWLFVWLTFLGALVALARRTHLGTDWLASRLSPRWRQACRLAGLGLMLLATGLLLAGALAQARINLEVFAPASGLPVAVFYAAGIAYAIPAIAVLLHQAWQLLHGLADDEAGGPRDTAKDLA